MLTHVLRKLPFSYTVNHLIFTVSKFGNFKKLAYWRSLILAVSQFKIFQSYILFLTGATIKGKNMLPLGSIFFPFIVAPVKK